MAHIEILQAFRDKLKTWAPCQGRVYVVPSLASMAAITAGFQTPLVALLYLGTTRQDLPGERVRSETRIEVRVASQIWKDDEVSLGGSGKTGVLQMCEELRLLLDYSPTENASVSRCEEILGTEEYPISDDGRTFAATSGFRMVVVEHE